MTLLTFMEQLCDTYSVYAGYCESWQVVISKKKKKIITLHFINWADNQSLSNSKQQNLKMRQI